MLAMCAESRGDAPQASARVISGKNGVTCAGRHGLVAAMNGGLREEIALVRKRRGRAVPGDQERLQINLGKSGSGRPRASSRYIDQ